MTCVWASRRASVFCGHRTPQGTLEVSSIATDTGHVEQLGSIPGYTSGTLFNVFFASGDDRSIYAQRGSELIRREIGAEQATTVEQMPGIGIHGIDPPYPTQRWIARSVNSTIQIRPLSGGDWKPIVTNRSSRMEFTPDGKWVYYFDNEGPAKQSLFRISTAGGKPERMGDFPGNSGRPSMFMSPDGRSLIVQGQIAPEAWVLENFEPKAPPSR